MKWDETKQNDVKTIEDYFKDWGSYVFGFGYGSGEEHIIPALKTFLELCNHDGRRYNYEELEKALTPTVAWLLINTLCKHQVDILEYGTSPRYAWLTEKGERLRDFTNKYTAEQLIEIVCNDDENYTGCYPDACNCGERGYEEGRICQNPFWLKALSQPQGEGK